MTIELSTIDRTLREEGAERLVQRSDAALRERLCGVAQSIEAGRMTRPFVLLAGPSGSGKTTVAEKLCLMLRERGCHAHLLSMDHYFYPLDPEGSRRVDLESPERVDRELLTEHLRRMAAGLPVEVPRFDFVSNTRVVKPEGRICRQPGEPVIVEGIHALNPETVCLPEEETLRLYVSVCTSLETPDGVHIRPQSLRLLRRMLRDARTRGKSPEETLHRMASVESGTTRYIRPYRCRAQREIDTFLAYEPGLYRTLILHELERMAPDAELTPLLTLLRAAEPVEERFLPEDSLCREFVGDGTEEKEV